MISKTHKSRPALEHKQGADFHYAGLLTGLVDGVEVEDYTGWTGKAELRDYSGNLISDLGFSWIDASEAMCQLYVPKATTQSWLVSRYEFDVVLTSPGGTSTPTDTATMIVTRGVTA